MTDIDINLQILVPPDLYAELPLPEFDPEDHSWEPLSACKPYMDDMEGTPWTDPVNANERRIVQRVCWLECDVRRHCLSAGLLPVWEPIGIFGGRNANQRRLLKRYWREQGFIPEYEVDEDCNDDDLYFDEDF